MPVRQNVKRSIAQNVLRFSFSVTLLHILGLHNYMTSVKDHEISEDQDHC